MNRTCWYFLLSYAHGSHRLLVDGARTRLQLPAPPWLPHRCKANSIDTSERFRKSKHGDIVGLVECSWGPVLDNILAPLSQEAAVLHSYYRRPQDCVVLNVERTLFFQIPKQVSFRVGEKSRSPNALSTICAEDPAEWMIDGHGRERRVCDALPTSGHIVFRMCVCCVCECF